MKPCTDLSNVSRIVKVIYFEKFYCQLRKGTDYGVGFYYFFYILNGYFDLSAHHVKLKQVFTKKQMHALAQC